MNFFDADGLPGKDLAEIDFFATQANSTAPGDHGGFIVERIVDILQAQTWAFSPRVMKQRDPLDEIYVRELHTRMFGETWKWAGKYRTRNGINLGCPFTEIHERMGALLGNVRFWIENKTFQVDEIAVRFHHQMVGQIHAFPNGNSRHARLIASVLAESLNRPRFTWGRTTLIEPGPARQAYLDALKAAHANEVNIQQLDLFARS